MECKALPRHAAGCRKNRQFAQKSEICQHFPARPGFSGTQRRNAL